MRPIFYNDQDCVEGARIGGAAPKGLESQFRDGNSQYFGTFPLPGDPDGEFSLFHRFDLHGDDEERDIIDHNNRVLGPSDLIWAVVHFRSVRGEASSRPFESCALEIGPDSADVGTNGADDEAPYGKSKLGGRCFSDRYWLREQVAALENDGFEQLLQIGMHGSDVIDGFSWDPGYLHVWASNPHDATTYRFLIEQ